MKKRIILVAALVLFAVSFLSSCRTSKPPCPAYQSIKVERIILDIIR